jgi:Dimerisation domain
MNFGIIPETVQERAAVRLGLVPVPVLDMLFGSIKARMIMVAVTLGVFETLRAGPLNAKEIADPLGLDRDTLECLLRALTHIKYLAHAKDRYALSPLPRRTMVGGAPMDVTGYVRWHETQWRFLEHLETLVRTGEGIDFHRTLRDRRLWRHYQRAMLTLARFDAATIARLVRFVPARHVYWTSRAAMVLSAPRSAGAIRRCDQRSSTFPRRWRRDVRWHGRLTSPTSWITAPATFSSIHWRNVMRRSCRTFFITSRRLRSAA